MGSLIVTHTSARINTCIDQDVWRGRREAEIEGFSAKNRFHGDAASVGKIRNLNQS